MLNRWAGGENARRMSGRWSILGGICWTLALIFAILGIIAEGINSTLGLTPMSWYLLAIALFAASIAWYIGWAVGLLYKE